MKPRTAEEEERLTPIEEEMRILENQLRYYKACDKVVRERCAYPKFCKHPGRCANTGRCQAEYCCID